MTIFQKIAQEDQERWRKVYTLVGLPDDFEKGNHPSWYMAQTVIQGDKDHDDMLEMFFLEIEKCKNKRVDISSAKKIFYMITSEDVEMINLGATLLEKLYNERHKKIEDDKRRSEAADAGVYQ